MVGQGTRSFEDREQHNIVRLLHQTMPTMHRLDEVFAWLACALIQHSGVSLAQFWTSPGQDMASGAPRLFASAAQDPSVPERVVANEEIKRLVERCAAEHLPPLFFSPEEAFSPYQATRLNRYGLRLGSCAFLQSTVPLSRLQAAPSSQEAPTRFAVTTLLFLSRVPLPDLWTTIHMTLERGVILAAEQGLRLSQVMDPPPVHTWAGRVMDT